MNILKRIVSRTLIEVPVLLEDARDLAGNPIAYFCDSGLSYEEKGGVLHVVVNHPRKNADHCIGG